MKDIKDYLHLYIGCDVYIFPTDTITDEWLKSVLKEQPELQYKVPLTANNLWQRLIEGYLPILRPLSDMTEEEAAELVRLKSEIYLNIEAEVINQYVLRFEFEYASSRRRRSTTIRFDELSPEQVRYLLSKGFDLFGLIESGLAIDKTTF